jgi:hypothetical protein
MTSSRLAASLLILFQLSSFASRLGGMARDGKETGQAPDANGRCVLEASAH